MLNEVNHVADVVCSDSWTRSDIASFKLNVKRFLRENPAAFVAVQGQAVDAFEIALAATDNDYQWSMVPPQPSAKVFAIAS